jgi:uncharacterized membrane protein
VDSHIAYHALCGARQATGQPTAKEILQAKYALGEITREQYQLMKQDIA